MMKAPRCLIIACYVSVLWGALACPVHAGTGNGNSTKWEIRFHDRDAFDSQLAELLPKVGTARVIFEPRLSRNLLPERVERWLYAVRMQGGSITMVRQSPPGRVRTRSSTVAATAIPTPFGDIPGQAYHAAAAVDAVLEYPPSGDELAEIRFVRRSE